MEALEEEPWNQKPKTPNMIRQLSAILTGIVSTLSLGAETPADLADMKIEHLLAGADEKKRF
jgi:hypothetical protein